MKTKLIQLSLLLSALISHAQTSVVINITDFRNDGLMSMFALQTGTVCTVEWASSLGDPMRTNWNALKSFVITNSPHTTDWPMFFRVRGVPTSGLTNGLLAFWPMNGNGNDISGNSNNVTAYTSMTWTNDRRGNVNAASQFNGSDSYMSVPDNDKLELTNDFSFAFWIKVPSGYTNNQSFISKHGWPDDTHSWDWAYYNKPAQGYYSEISFVPPYDASYPRITNVTMGVWNHFAFTFQKTSGQWTFYMNGVLATSGITTNMQIANNARPIGFGHDSDGAYPGTVSFPGALDSVRIYNRVLTANDVANIYLIDPQ